MKFRNVAIASTAAVIASVAIGTGAAQATSLIGGKDIRDGSVHRIDLSAGVDKALNKAGTPGAKGEQGAPRCEGRARRRTGEQGEARRKDAALHTYVVQPEFDVPAGDTADGNVWATAGDRLLTGGYSSNDHHNHWAKISEPLDLVAGRAGRCCRQRQGSRRAARRLVRAGSRWRRRLRDRPLGVLHRRLTDCTTNGPASSRWRALAPTRSRSVKNGVSERTFKVRTH